MKITKKEIQTLIKNILNFNGVYSKKLLDELTGLFILLLNK